MEQDHGGDENGAGTKAETLMAADDEATIWKNMTTKQTCDDCRKRMGGVKKYMQKQLTRCRDLLNHACDKVDDMVISKCYHESQKAAYKMVCAKSCSKNQ